MELGRLKGGGAAPDAPTAFLHRARHRLETSAKPFPRPTFQLGILAGLALAGGGYVVYAVPAAVLDWPRLSLGDIGDFLMAVVEAVVGFFVSLFD